MPARAIDVKPLGHENVICCWNVDGVLIDPGPESCLETLLEALGDEVPRAVLLTHIHFDHAGGAGALVQRWPDLPVYVHEVGAPHMISPERLVASATRLYGEEGMRTLWGRVVPIPEQNVQVLKGGEEILGAYEVAYTPGHASHHVCYRHQESGWAFVGDVAGVRIAPSDYVIAPTPPPDIDLAAWERSIRKLEDWKPSTLALTHFGAVTNVEQQLVGLRESLRFEAELSGNSDQEGFVAAMRERIIREAGDTAPAYLQAAPLEHLWFGLDRWRRKQVEAQ